MDSFGFSLRKLAICFADLFVEFSRLLFHPVRRRRRSNPSQHARSGGASVHIKKKGHIRHAIAHGERIQLLDHASVELSRHALINCRRIKKTIGDDANATLERRPDRFPNELTSARFEEKQFGFGSHARTVRRELQQVLDRFTDGRSTRLTRDKQGNAGPFEPLREESDLRGFSAAFRAFKSNERETRHGSDCEAEADDCRMRAAV